MLSVSLLGEQAIIDDASGAVRTRSSRAVALIAYLVAHAGAPQTRQRISLLFWPDSTDAQALTNLRRELHHVRQVLGDQPSLVVTSTDLSWRDTDTARVDLRTFQTERVVTLAAAADGDEEAVIAHGTAAIASYGGEFLPGGYDDWILELREELLRECVDLCTTVCGAQTRRGDLTAAVVTARRRLALEPLEESGYRTLMELQADLGDRAGAVSTYHHCASVLERELGVIPDQATRNTLQRLLVPQQREDDPPVPLPADSASARLGFATTGLVGRASELATLGSAWQQAASGQPRLVVVSGGAGVGKTRLVSEVSELARLQGAVVAVAQCFGTSGRLALAPVADWLRTSAVQAALGGLDPVLRTEVQRLIPSAVVSREDGDASARAMVDAWQRHRFFEGLARALLGVRRPLLLVLDNMQWCDQETLAFIAFFLSLEPDAALMVAATRRDDDLDEDPDLRDWTLRMRATGRLSEVSLSPLEPSDTIELATAIAGPSAEAPDASLMQAMTGGFPLYVIEAVRAMAGASGTYSASGDLAGVLRHRLEQATPTAREIAGLASAVGRDFDLELLTEASDHEADAVVRAVDELWGRRILRELADGYDFSHDLLREAAYQEVSPPRRWLLHRRLAQGLELLHADDIDTVSAQLAEQYARGGRGDRAIAYYRRAAEVASERFAHLEAIRLLREAHRLTHEQPRSSNRDREELSILEAMAAPLTALFGYADVRLERLLERTVVVAERLRRKDSVIEALFGLWTSRFVQGRMADSYEGAVRSMELAKPGSEQAGAAHFGIGGSMLALGRPTEAIEHFDRAAKLNSGGEKPWTIGTRPDVLGQAFYAHAQWLVGRAADARDTASHAVAVARSAEHPFSLAVALAYSAVTHQMLEDEAGLRPAVDELCELCERYGFAYYREWALILDGWSRPGASGLGRAQMGVDNLKAEGSFARMPYWLGLLADLQGRAGQRDAARATLDAAVVAGYARDDLWWLPEVIRMRAAYEEGPARLARLESARALAAKQGSVALLERCERDLAAGVLPRS
ncbi:MAG TPA: AAA family ATPase [Frankiaceae bacterium]|nr:AAA family ATPase [Frankiaceae bacterium]